MIRAVALATILFISSCTYLVTNHKKHVIDLYTCGDKDRPIRTDGYYYSTSEVTNYPYYKTQYGGYDQDLSKPFLQKTINPITLHKDGTVLTFNLFSGYQENDFLNYSEKCGLQDSNTFENAKLHFECYLKDFKNNYPIWGKGVFKTSKDSIIIQYYTNWTGYYYLVEKTGILLSDSTFTLSRRFDYFLNREENIEEAYSFQKTDFKPDSSNYLLLHKRQFKKSRQ